MDSVSNFFVSNVAATQFGLFAAFLIFLWLIEKFAVGELLLDKLRHTGLNALFLVGAFPIQGIMMMSCLGLAGWATRHHVGLLQLLPHASSPWIKYGLMFVVLDGLDYLYHTTMHRVPLLWRLHSVHHTDHAVDVSTTFREHPGETLIRNGFLMLWVLLCGASVEVLILRQTIESAANIFAHTSLPLRRGPARILSWLFITPNLHHAHHHFQLPATNSNYGDVFSIWDRLFGTFIDMPCADIAFGLDTHMDQVAARASSSTAKLALSRTAR